MNPIQMQQLVDQLLALPDTEFDAGNPVTDQVDAALKDPHNQTLLLDTLFRTMARHVFAVTGSHLDVHHNTVAIKVNTQSEDSHVIAGHVINALSGYLCGKPHTIVDALDTFGRAVEGYDTHTVFGVLVGLGLVLRRRTVPIEVH